MQAWTNAIARVLLVGASWGNRINQLKLVCISLKLRKFYLLINTIDWFLQIFKYFGKVLN